jgi:hypothetical protein
MINKLSLSQYLIDLKVIKSFSYYLLIFWILTFSLVLANQYTLAIIIFGGLVVFLSRNQPKLIISLYIYFISLNSIIGTQYNVFVVGFDEIVFISFLFFFLNSKTKVEKEDRIQKYSIRIVILIAFLQFYATSKGILLGIDNEHSVYYVAKNLFKIIVRYYPLIILIKNVRVSNYRFYIIAGILLAVITIVSSQPFTDTLISLGFNIKSPLYSMHEVDGGALRSMGFYGAGGDENSLGGFLSIIFGLGIILYENDKKLKIINTLLILLPFLGVFYTASRTAILCLSFIMFMFVIRNFNNAKLIKITITLGLLFIAFSSTIYSSFMRFFADSAINAISLESSSSGRVYKWVRYLIFINNNPITYLIGNITQIDFNRSVHNYFILIIYSAGLTPFFIFISNIVKIITSYIKNGKNYNILYLIIPFLMIIGTVNSAGAGIYVWIILPLLHSFEIYSRTYKLSNVAFNQQ